MGGLLIYVHVYFALSESGENPTLDNGWNWKKYVVHEYLCVEVVEKIEHERKEYGMRKL